MGDKLREQKGVALAFVLVALVFVVLMAAIVAMLANTNIRQASAQESGMQAYYVARSGAELAYDAIMTTTLLNEFEADPSKTLDSKDLDPAGIDFEKGTADVTVSSSGSGDTQTIQIESVGTLKGSGISRTVTLEFYVNYDKYPNMVWSR